VQDSAAKGPASIDPALIFELTSIFSALKNKLDGLQTRRSAVNRSYG
jgi:hypothetical protein